jgi:quercetin dioxygenase-like cupin family protein
MRSIPVSDTTKSPASKVVGDVYGTDIGEPEGISRLIVGLVRFTPGARTNWHSHANGQTLYCTEGIGLVVNRNGDVIRLRAGDTAWTGPGEEHWHGGTDATFMCHIAMLVDVEDGEATTWLEPVTDDEYAAAHL